MLLLPVTRFLSRNCGHDASIHDAFKLILNFLMRFLRNTNDAIQSSNLFSMNLKSNTKITQKW